jgi:hypothetical protein
VREGGSELAGFAFGVVGDVTVAGSLGSTCETTRIDVSESKSTHAAERPRRAPVHTRVFLSMLSSFMVVLRAF